MQNVIAVLFEIGPDNVLIILNAAKTTLEECMKNAYLINADSTHQFVMLCGPDINAVTADAS